MRIFTCFIPMLLILFSVQANAQRANEKSDIMPLKSLRITKKAAKRYLDQKKKMKHLVVSRDGMVTPAPGYKMAKSKDGKFYFLGSEKSQFSSRKEVSGFDIIVVFGEEVYCMCSDWADDCSWSGGGGTEIFLSCGGGCDCYAKWEYGTIFKGKEIMDEVGPGS